MWGTWRYCLVHIDPISSSKLIPSSPSSPYPLFFIRCVRKGDKRIRGISSSVESRLKRRKRKHIWTGFTNTY